METNKCPNCGHEIAGESLSCDFCGYLFEEEVDPEDITIEHSEEIEYSEEEHLENEQSENEQPETIVEVKKKTKKRTICMRIAFVLSILLNVFLFMGRMGFTDSENELMSKNKVLEEENTALTQQLSEAQQQVNSLTLENDELKNGASNQLVNVRNAYEKGEWQNTIDLANQLHEKYNGTEEDKQAQEMATASKAKLDEEAATKAAAEAKGYETGITYDQLARTPDQFIGQKVKFYGKVIQVIEGDSSVQIRLAVNDDYDTVLLGEYATSTVASRVLEDDHIMIYGTSVGTISYQSTMGGKITIPGVYIEKIDQ